MHDGIDDFTIYTHEAGAGSLFIAMEGPAKADIDLKDNKDGTCDVQYTCTEPGRPTLFIATEFMSLHCFVIWWLVCVLARLIKRLSLSLIILLIKEK